MATITTNSDGFTWEYSYSTSETASAINVAISIYFKASYQFRTSETPGFCPCAVPNTSLSSVPQSVLNDTSGSALNAWVSNNGGAGQTQWIEDKTHPAGKYFESSFTVSIPKTTSARNVTLYIGAIIQSTYFWNIFFGQTSVNISVPSSHTHPSNLTITNLTSEKTSITTQCSWTSGVAADAKVDVTIGSTTKTIDDFGDVLTFTGLTPNYEYDIHYELWDVPSSGGSHRNIETTDRKRWTKIEAPTLSLSSTTTTITATAGANGNANVSYRYKLDDGQWGTSNVFTVQPNTYHTVYVKIVNPSNTIQSESEVVQSTIWSRPVINTPILSLKAGSEHNTIIASVSAQVASQYDQFAYRIDNGNWSAWTAATTYSFSGLDGYSNHTIGVKMKNTSSTYESAEKTATLRTWYNPVTELTCLMTNRWFWYLAVNCSFSYQGGAVNIVKYEFDIGGEGYKDKATVNGHSRGNTNWNDINKLNANTDYICKVRITDNHGRTYESSNTFKTMDERVISADGTLRTMYVTKSNGSKMQVTPNLMTIIKPDGTKVLMNKKINNDSRIEFS